MGFLGFVVLTQLPDGEHVLRIAAADALGKIGLRRGLRSQTVLESPVTGLRADSRVRGTVEIDVNAFGSNEPFDPVRAESSGPVPVWTWVFAAVIAAWAAWYGIEYFKTPTAFARTPTYASNPALAISNAPASRSQGETVAPVARMQQSAARTSRASTIHPKARRFMRRTVNRATARVVLAYLPHFHRWPAIRS
jgi:hypothetical protein